MSFSRHFLKKYNFAYSRCTGTLDDQGLRVHTLSFQLESRGMPFVRELLDFRSLQRADRLTVQGLIEICELERQRSEDRDFRLAMLAHGPLMVQLAEVYAKIILTDNLRTTVIEGTPGQALVWLGYDAARVLELTRFVKRCSAAPA